MMSIPNRASRVWSEGLSLLAKKMYKELVTDSACLSSTIAKPNMTIKTRKLNIFWNFLALICKAEIPYTPHKFLFIIFFIRFNFIFLSIDHILLIESELIISNIILIFPGDDSKRICVGFVRLKKMLQHWLMTTATATEFQIPWGLDKSKARPQTVTEII